MMNLRKHMVLLKGLFPFTFLAIIWIVQLAQGFLQQDWSEYSLHPRHADGLIGIITAPLLHGSWQHLLGNSVPLLVLGLLLFATYKDIAGKVFWLIYFLNGILLWCFARPAYHLGASGVVYGLASFLFFSGFVRRNSQLTIISFLVVFLYGYMAHGVFPFFPEISWEGHLYGALTGLVLAIVLRKEGPQPRKYFEDEEDDETELKVVHNNLPETENKKDGPDVPDKEDLPAELRIKYHWVENDKKSEK